MKQKGHGRYQMYYENHFRPHIPFTVACHIFVIFRFFLYCRHVSPCEIIYTKGEENVIGIAFIGCLAMRDIDLQ